MYTYDLFQWMLFFFVYCFFGWCIESAIVSVSSRRLVNRGFLRIPMLPLYGFGAVLILFLTIPVQDMPWLVYVIGAVGATILEYFTGWAMECLFKMKYWDYSDKRIQLHGRICLSSSLFWGVLSVALTEYIHPPIEHWILGLNHLFVILITVCAFCIMLTDTIVSAKTALDLAKVLEHLESVREEISALRTQLDDLKEDFKETSQQQIGGFRENLKERADHIKGRLAELTSLRETEMSQLGFLKSQLLKRHPSAYSKKFNDTLRELKERLYKN